MKRSLHNSSLTVPYPEFLDLFQNYYVDLIYCITIIPHMVMSKKIIKPIFYKITWGFLILGILFFCAFLFEEIELKRIASRVPSNIPIQEKVLQIHNIVAERLSANQKSLSKRYWRRRIISPLRDSAWKTWRSKEGLCGDDARLSLNLLRHLNVRAHRVYLYHTEIRYRGHVAYEYFNGKQWIYMDVYNAPGGIHTYALQHPKSLHVHIHSSRKNPLNELFNDYSYFPRNRVLFYKSLYIHNRFPETIVFVFENPPFLKAVLFAFVSLTSFIIGKLIFRT